MKKRVVSLSLVLCLLLSLVPISTLADSYITMGTDPVLENDIIAISVGEDGLFGMGLPGPDRWNSPWLLHGYPVATLPQTTIHINGKNDVCCKGQT